VLGDSLSAALHSGMDLFQTMQCWSGTLRHSHVTEEWAWSETLGSSLVTED